MYKVVRKLEPSGRCNPAWQVQLHERSHAMLLFTLWLTLARMESRAHGQGHFQAFPQNILENVVVCLATWSSNMLFYTHSQFPTPWLQNLTHSCIL